jgi:hypothetical protein
VRKERRILGRLEGKRPLERPRHRWVDDIKMDLQDVRIGSSWPRIWTGGGHL